MTPFVWMFIQSYKKLREYIINFKNISSLIQFEYSAFSEATVPICSFVLSNEQEYNASKKALESEMTNNQRIIDGLIARKNELV